MSRCNFAALSLIALALLFGAPHAAQAETYNTCTGFITSLPTTISTQGTWCFNKDLSTAITGGNAITIGTNNVTIDCNNFKLGGLAAGIGTAAVGIVAVDRQNTTVRHCNIRGFYSGVDFHGSGGANIGGGHIVEDNIFDGNTYYGISVSGDGSVLRRNRIINTGDSTVSDGPAGVYSFYGVDVIDNTISGVVSRSGSNASAFGMFLSPIGTSTVRGNLVSGLVPDGSGSAIGVEMNTVARYILSENEVLGSGSAGSVGLECFNTLGRAKDNVVTGFATGIQACGNAGGNDITP